MRGASWEALSVAINDHARVTFTEHYAHKSQESACHFLGNAHAYFSSLNARPMLLTANGSAFPSRSLKSACKGLGQCRINLEIRYHRRLGRGDSIIVGGGGAELLLKRLKDRYPNAVSADEPRMMVAEGFCRLGMLSLLQSQG